MFCDHKRHVGFKCCNVLGKNGINGTESTVSVNHVHLCQATLHTKEHCGLTFASTVKLTGECLITENIGYQTFNKTSSCLNEIVWYQLDCEEEQRISGILLYSMITVGLNCKSHLFKFS